MPPGSETVLVGLLNTILSQYGALVGLLVFIVLYQNKELREERTRHAATATRLLDVTREAVATNAAAATAMATLRTIVERYLFRDRRDAQEF